MNRNINMKSKHKNLWFVVAILLVVLSGCNLQTQPQTSADVNDYTGVLDVSYEDALDPSSQLALGILELVGTPNAVAADQAILLLPMWEVLQGTALKSDAERQAVLFQIESILEANQISAIQSMELTPADASLWLESQDSDRSVGVIQGASGKEQLEGEMPERAEELRTSRENVDISVTGTSGISTLLMRAVVELLSSSESEAVVADVVVDQVLDESTAVSESKSPVQPTSTPKPVEPVEEVQSVGDKPELITPTPEVIGTETVTLEPTQEQSVIEEESAQPVMMIEQETTQQLVTVAPALDQIPDTDPGPPFSIEITTNYAVPNPDLEQGWIYTVGGFVRNDSDQTYSLSAVHVTFFDADGFRGAFYPFPSSGGGRSQSGEWITHGRMEADFACLVLAPGQTCPFIAEIAAHDMESFLVHPDATVLEWHEAATVELDNISVIDDGLDSIRIYGTVHNQNAYAVKNVMITGALNDTAGQMVSFGTAILQESIEPGADVAFEVWVEKVPYVDYKLHVAAEGDFN